MLEDGTRISQRVQRMMCFICFFLSDNSFEIQQLELGCQEMQGSTDLGRWVVREDGPGTALAESVTAAISAWGFRSTRTLTITYLCLVDERKSLWITRRSLRHLQPARTEPGEVEARESLEQSDQSRGACAMGASVSPAGEMISRRGRAAPRRSILPFRAPSASRPESERARKPFCQKAFSSFNRTRQRGPGRQSRRLASSPAPGGALKLSPLKRARAGTGRSDQPAASAGGPLSQINLPAYFRAKASSPQTHRQPGAPFESSCSLPEYANLSLLSRRCYHTT
jgi:hypothetical protein